MEPISFIALTAGAVVLTTPLLVGTAVATALAIPAVILATPVLLISHFFI